MIAAGVGLGGLLLYHFLPPRNASAKNASLYLAELQKTTENELNASEASSDVSTLWITVGVIALCFVGLLAAFMLYKRNTENVLEDNSQEESIQQKQLQDGQSPGSQSIKATSNRTAK